MTTTEDTIAVSLTSNPVTNVVKANKYDIHSSRAIAI